jgi:hypothetical protein
VKGGSSCDGDGIVGIALEVEDLHNKIERSRVSQLHVRSGMWTSTTAVQRGEGATYHSLNVNGPHELAGDYAKRSPVEGVLVGARQHSRN